MAQVDTENVFPSKQCVHTDGFLRQELRRCLIKVLYLFIRIFPVNPRALVTCPCTFRLRRLARTVRPDLGFGHFSCKFLHRMALGTCPCAFRLRRLAQTVRVDVRFLHLFCNFSGLLWHESLRCGPSQASGMLLLYIFIVHSRVNGSRGFPA